MGHVQFLNLLLKNLSLKYKKLVLELFNKILITGEIPGLWKCAEITMIPKSGDKFDWKNYRPVSITSSLCKLFEKLLVKRILKFPKQHNILNNYQSGL